jgi:hypothetical protein
VPGVEVKFAVTDFGDVTFVSAQVEPEQSPLQPANVNPEEAVAVQVLLPPWLTGLLVQLTVPPAGGLAAVVIGYEFRLKFAVTARAEVTLVNVQVVPVQFPLQPVKV